MADKGIADTIRASQLPTNSPTQLYLSQYGLVSNQPVIITPGLGSSGGGPLPPIQTGGAHWDITVTRYMAQAGVEAREV